MSERLDDMGLRDLIDVLWMGKWLVAGATLAAMLAAVVHGVISSKVYRAETLLQARQESPAGAGLAAFAPGIGGLAELAGLSVGGGGDKAVAVATLQSRALIEQFIGDRNLLPKLFPSGWDATTGQWKGSAEDMPSRWEGYNRFIRKNLQISEDRKTGLVTLAIEWADAKEAQALVSELVSRANARLKATAIAEAEKNLQYLQEQAKHIGQVEVRQALFRLVESELNKLMVARASDEFAFKTVDPAVVPTKPARPNRSLLFAIYVFVGLISGIVICLSRSALARG